MHWISDLLTNNHNIPNFSIQECLCLFGREVWLQNYFLVTIGRKQEKKEVAFIKLLKNVDGNHPLKGTHCVQIYTAEKKSVICWVVSLCNLRHELFQFEDHLSFERSTFLIHPPTCQLIRLKCLRPLLRLPSESHSHIPREFVIGISNLSSSSTNNHFNPQISSRTRSQFQRTLEQIYTSYIRDMNPSKSKLEILDMLRDDIEEYLTELGAAFQTSR